MRNQPELKKPMSSDISVTTYDANGNLCQIRLFEQNDGILVFAMTDAGITVDMNTFVHGEIIPAALAQAVAGWFEKKGYLAALSTAMMPAIAKDVERMARGILSE